MEVVYALPARADCVTISVPAGCSLREAIVASGVLDRHPEIGLQETKVGVFGHARSLDSAAREGDRIEIYRPLAADPKEARRRRAAAGKRRR